jgi:hypothetical protein
VITLREIAQPGELPVHLEFHSPYFRDDSNTVGEGWLTRLDFGLLERAYNPTLGADILKNPSDSDYWLRE